LKAENYGRPQGFCAKQAELQNSTVVFQLNFSNKFGFCALISRPNAKPQTVGHIFALSSALTMISGNMLQAKLHAAIAKAKARRKML
jgi:hypothetical protein